MQLQLRTLARSTLSRASLAALALSLMVVALPATPASAQQAGMSDLPDLSELRPSERRERFRPIYEELRTDVQFNALRDQLEANWGDRETLDRFLRYLPISPMELLQIDMQVNHYEHMIPRYIHEWHERWVELHEKKAVAHYGAERVQAILGGGAADRGGDPEAGGAPSLVERATVSTNRNAAASSGSPANEYQGEIQLAVNPNNPNQIVAGANTFHASTCGAQTQAIWYSSDGGTTWNYTCAPGNTSYSGLSCSATPFGSDPAVAWDDSGNVYLEYMMLCSSFFSTSYSIVIARSTDGGATWSPRGIVANSYGSPGTVEDKQFLAVDNNPGSPFYGRMYTCWDRNNNEKSAYSTNGGQTWTEVDLPTAPVGGIDLGCDLAVEDNGTVHVVWDSLTCGGSTCSDERMWYTRSTNGGVSWSSPVQVRDYNLTGFSGTHCPDAQDERCIGPFGAIDVDNSGGACDGILYATFTDYTSGGVNNSDVWVSRSTNGGSTWGAPVLVNDDGLTNRVQFHPFLVVDQSNGTPVVGWHDARNDSGNDAIDYYVSRSTDCGLTWEANTQVSQPSSEFNNSTISYSNENSSDNPGNNPNQYGEYLGLDAQNGKAYLGWADTRHFFPSFTSNAQKENLGFAVIDFGGGTGGNTPPSVNITAPSSGSSFTQGTSVTFTGTATDAQDGTLTSSLAWSSSLDGSIGSGGSFSTSTLSVGTHTITASVTDSGSLSGSDSISVTITSTGGGNCTTIDFNSLTTQSYAGQDISGNVSVADAGATLVLQQNTWRRSTTTFNVTATTVLNFDFQSTSQGEIHGIGFDENNTLADAVRVFQLYGTQNWTDGDHTYDDYATPGTYKSYSIPVGTFYTGSAMNLVFSNDKDSGTLSNNSRFRNVQICDNGPPTGSCTLEDDFSGSLTGWSNSGSSTCSTGAFIAGTPTLVTNGGVTTQVGGDHTSGSGIAIFTASNSSAGVNDVDGGECILDSPTWSVTNASTLSVWYFHGQRDTGGDSNDFFRLQVSTNGGSSYANAVNIGDVTTNAAWTQATFPVPAGSNVRLRLRVSDGTSAGDLVEGGIDDLAICDN